MPSIFTRIIDGEIPGRFLWRDDVCVAFLDVRPLGPGHALVVPRAEVDHVGTLTMHGDVAGQHDEHLVGVATLDDQRRADRVLLDREHRRQRLALGVARPGRKPRAVQL